MLSTISTLLQLQPRNSLVTCKRNQVTIAEERENGFEHLAMYSGCAPPCMRGKLSAPLLQL